MTQGLFPQNGVYPQGNLVQRQRQGNNAADVMDTALYDAYGLPIADTDVATGNSEAYQDPVGFGGQHGYYHDTESGLSLLTNRYYAPKTGRFITRDPIGYEGGINLYGFDDNDPVNEMDPSGTDDLLDTGANFFYGLGGVISGGATNWIDHRLGVDGGIDRNSKAFYAGVVAGYTYLAADSVVGGVGVVSGIRAIKSAGSVRAVVGASTIARAKNLGLSYQIRKGGAVHILEDAKTLSVTETHTGILNVFKKHNGGSVNLIRKEFWKHVLPHQHTYSLPTPPANLNQNWRTTFQNAGATKVTKIWRP